MKRNSIQLKIISFIILILFITITIVISITVTNQKNDLINASKNTLAIITDMLNNTIKSIMLSGEAPIAVRTMLLYKSISELKEVEIYRVNGDVAFNDYSTMQFVNKFQTRIMFNKTERVDKKIIDNKYFIKSRDENTPVRTPDRELYMTKEMEYFFPIRNERDCWGCHGDSETVGQIRGIAHFKISIKGIFKRINNATIFLTTCFVGVGIILAILIIFLMRKIIIQPLFKIGSTVNQFGQDNLGLSIHLRNKGDELSDLANKLNEMFIRIKERFELSKFVSKSTDEMIKKGELISDGGLKKNVTVVFSDIRGFTSYSESKPPVEVVKNLNRILQIQADIIEKFNGDVDKFVGDEVMAVFDDPYKAVKAAFEMIVNVKNMNKMYNTSLFIGIGINTGEVIAGNIGSQNRLEYAIIGDTVNLASRLCGIAKPNMMLISSTTFDILKDKIDAKLIADQKIKGKTGSINFYVVKSIN